jgi:hypothetical protein
MKSLRFMKRSLNWHYQRHAVSLPAHSQTPLHELVVIARRMNLGRFGVCETVCPNVGRFDLKEHG